MDDPHARADQTHHYEIPEALRAQLQPGCLVIVPFGRRLRRGWVLGFDEQAPVDAVKPLVATLPEAPPLNVAQIALARWLSRRANVGIARGLAIALPSAWLDVTVSRLHLARGRGAELEAHGEPGATLLKRLKVGPLRLDRAWLLLPAAAPALLPALEAAGVLQRLPPKAAPCPAVSADAAPVAPLPALPDRATREMCSAVFADVTKGRGSVFLVTSTSWPGEAIEQLVRHTVGAGKQVLLLVPRPGPPAERLRALLTRFPGALWLRGNAGVGAIADRQPSLVVGGRWAAFAPFASLGLVLVLEEHDPAFAGDHPPFVHGREIALQAARFGRATTVLCSPNPDPATLWRANRAGVRRFTLGTPSPVHVVTVDLRQELRAGRTALLSEPLRLALTTTVAAGEQALLFLNRRGAAAMVICRRCGLALSCPRCSTSLTYHAGDGDSDAGTMCCHCCNYVERRPAVCPRCRTATLDELGVGVQRLAQEVQQAIPGARLARWDRDVAPGAAAGRVIARRFAGKEIDVLIGTQPVALAEDLPPVALAAAALADLGLHLPDYRAAERSYELLAALRRRVAVGGQLILQTYLPSHWVLQSLAADDPALYYGEELRRRQELGYPPFAQLARLTYRAASRQRCEAEALAVRAALAQRLADVAPGLTDALLGPAPAFVERVDGVYRRQIHLRAPNVQLLLSAVPPHWQVEVDPEDLR